jgi:hypothetical protein
MERFEVWISTSREMGQFQRSRRVYVCQANTFDEACSKFVERYPEYRGGWKPETRQIDWDQKLFPSKKEADAYLR